MFLCECDLVCICELLWSIEVHLTLPDSIRPSTVTQFGGNWLSDFVEQDPLKLSQTKQKDINEKSKISVSQPFEQAL